MDVITIVIDVYPATGSKPATVVVAATPQGGTPHFASGPFADRHKLLDQAYGEAAKRAVKAETGKASKPKAGKGGKSGKAGNPRGESGGRGGSTPAFGEPGHLKAAAEDPAQRTAGLGTGPIGPAEDKGTATPLVEAPDDLPVIEGDGEAQLELTLEGSDGK